MNPESPRDSRPSLRSNRSQPTTEPKMPYPNERASRLGHVPVVNNQAVQDAFARWRVAQAAPEDESRITSLCTPLTDLAHSQRSNDIRFAITVDGSDTEVEATRE